MLEVGMDIIPTVAMGKLGLMAPGASKEGENRCSISLQDCPALTHQAPLLPKNGGPPALRQEWEGGL